ncbi:MAG: ABC transporter ATP-binding protein [Planctomycetota bacterium]|jgi:ABC-2 type transport system ATP-binding protein
MLIEAQGLSKWYGQVIGLNDVTVGIGPGVTGLLGPNGAGKTTFLRLMTGQLRPSQGRITLFGESVWNNRNVLSRIGFCPEEDAFYNALSGYQFVTLLARISGLPLREAKRRAAEVLDRVGMAGAMHRRIRGYSKGMRQRTKFAQAIVHDPEFLFLDEPLTGTDPVGRRDLRELITFLATQGKHVVVSSHVLYEVEAMTENFVLIHHGRAVASGNIHEIRALMDGYPHRILIRSSGVRRLAEALIAQTHVLGVEVDGVGKTLRVQTEDPATFFTDLPATVLDAGVDVSEMFSEDDNLNAVFRYLVTR